MPTVLELLMRSSLALAVAVPLAAAAAVLSGCGSSTPLFTASSPSQSSSTATPSPTPSATASSSSSSSSSSLSASHDPCALLTAADIAGVLGGSFTKATGTANVCGYADISTSTAVAISTADLPAAAAGTAGAASAVKAAAGTTGGTVSDISGIGDAAAGSSSNGKTLVAFVKGNALVVVVIQGTSVTDAPTKAQALAQAVAAKL